ncbi:unnamed protein product [Closterium sp. Naga37s-1]|nr:unnamed protein product [Closterium sp. Naga37s-1]
MDCHVLSLLCRLLLCATVCTAYGAASATSFAPLLSQDGGSSAASAAQATKPLVWKGKTMVKYVAKLSPTKRNGKVVGDAGASGKIVLKAVRYSATSFRVLIDFQFLNVGDL